MIPGILASELGKEFTPDNVKKLKNELLKQFGLDEESNYEGLDLLAVLFLEEGIPILKEMRSFLKNMLILEEQLKKYLDSLGADLGAAEKTVEDTAVQTGLDWAEMFHLGGL